MDTVKRIVCDTSRILIEYDDHQILELNVLTGTGSIWDNARLVSVGNHNEWTIIDPDTYDPPRKIRSACPQEYTIGLGTALCALMRQT